MNRSELVAALAEKTGLTKKYTDYLLQTFIDTVEDEVVSGNKVRIVGFGVFDSKERAARKGVNPRTGESMIIESAKIPTFKAGSEFKNLLK